MRFQNALENARLTMQALVFSLLLSFLLNIFLIIGWDSTQKKIEVHLPPEIPVSGLTLQANSYPPSSVYSFAYYIWQSINNWPRDGKVDYQKSINAFSPFLTPRFEQFLIRDYNQRLNEGEIQDRTRTLQGLNGSAFSVSDVKAIGHHTWLVHLHFRLTEQMNINANKVKDAAIDYVIRVVRYEIDAKSNPWGLALDGFEEDPKRITTYT